MMIVGSGVSRSSNTRITFSYAVISSIVEADIYIRVYLIKNQDSRLTCPVLVTELLIDLALFSEPWAIGSECKRNWNHDCG